MEYNPYREANGLSAGQEIPHLLWSLEIHCLVHRSLPLVSVLNHINPVNFQIKPYFLTVCFNMVLHSSPKSRKMSLLFVFFGKNRIYLSYACYMSHTPHLHILSP